MHRSRRALELIVRGSKESVNAWDGALGAACDALGSAAIVPAMAASHHTRSLPTQIRVYEVGPRDGLQNEKDIIATESKIKLVDLLSATGLRKIEAGAFVHPKRVPQMADTPQVIGGIRRQPGVAYPVLVPNVKGLERALEAAASHGVTLGEIAIFTSASEDFNQKNLNCSVQKSLEGFLPIMEIAKAERIDVRGYVSVAMGCPYSGRVDPDYAARICNNLYELGCYEISMGDTVGLATPADVVALVRSCVAVGIPVEKLALHAHDTRGMALANVYAGLQEGISVIDSAIGGLGGCPFAATASNGNLATEDLLYMLRGLGIETGVDYSKVLECSKFVQDGLGLTNHSRVARQELSNL